MPYARQPACASLRRWTARSLQPDSSPRSVNGPRHAGESAIHVPCHRSALRGTVPEIAFRQQVMHHLVPHLADLAPGIAADLRRRQIEGVIRDARIDMHPPVVGSTPVTVSVVLGLWVVAKLRVAGERRAGGLQAPERRPRGGGHEELLPDEPV